MSVLPEIFWIIAILSKHEICQPLMEMSWQNLQILECKIDIFILYMPLAFWKLPNSGPKEVFCSLLINLPFQTATFNNLVVENHYLLDNTVSLTFTRTFSKTSAWNMWRKIAKKICVWKSFSFENWFHVKIVKKCNFQLPKTQKWFHIKS